MLGKTDVISSLKHQQQKKCYYKTNTFSIKILIEGEDEKYVYAYFVCLKLIYIFQNITAFLLCCIPQIQCL